MEIIYKLTLRVDIRYNYMPFVFLILDDCTGSYEVLYNVIVSLFTLTPVIHT